MNVVYIKGIYYAQKNRSKGRERICFLLLSIIFDFSILEIVISWFPSALNSISNDVSSNSYPSGAFISVILYFPKGNCVIAFPSLFVVTSVSYSSEEFNVKITLFIVNLSSPSLLEEFL